MLDRRLGVEVNTNLFLPGSPSQAPVPDANSKGVSDPPPPKPHCMPGRHGAAEGGPELECIQPELAQLSPSILSFLGFLCDRGIDVPSEVLTMLVRSVTSRFQDEPVPSSSR